MKDTHLMDNPTPFVKFLLSQVNVREKEKKQKNIRKPNIGYMTPVELDKFLQIMPPRSEMNKQRFEMNKVRSKYPYYPSGKFQHQGETHHTLISPTIAERLLGCEPGYFTFLSRQARVIPEEGFPKIYKCNKWFYCKQEEVRDFLKKKGLEAVDWNNLTEFISSRYRRENIRFKLDDLVEKHNAYLQELVDQQPQ